MDLFVEDAVDMAHGEVHDYLIDMDGVSSSAFEGDMKVGDKPGAQERKLWPGTPRRTWLRSHIPAAGCLKARVYTYGVKFTPSCHAVPAR